MTLSGDGASTGTAGGSLFVGGANGNGVLNLNSSGTSTFATSSSSLLMYVGGNGGASDTGSGAVNQSSGILNFGNVNYLTFGVTGRNTYGAYTLSGGTLNITAGAGIRLGFGGIGSFVQSGGILNCGRYFAIGTSSSTSKGVATFTGGTAAINSSYRFNIPDAANATAVMNLGTEAGGTAVITHPNTTGLNIQNAAGGNGTLNINRGTLQLGGPIYRNNSSGGSAVLNLNGGTLQAGANNLTLIKSGLSSVNVYNGGVVVDTQTYTVTNPAALLIPAGNGLYPAGGTLAIASGGGSGYIGAPFVTVTTSGAGSNAMAIANISGGVVTGVTLICPGQNYLAGDTLMFDFAGGGTATPADPFIYTLAPSDLAANATGGLTKIGSGNLILTVPNTYAGNTVVNDGILTVTADGALGAGNVLVTNGAVLTMTSSASSVNSAYIATTANLVVSPTGLVNLNFTGTNTIKALSLDGGLTYVATGTWGAVGSSAANQSSQFAGTGIILTRGASAIATVTVASSLNPSLVGEAVTFIATATGANGIPTGSVVFKDGATVLGSATLDGSGNAAITTSGLVAGSRSVTAGYTGDGTYGPAASDPLTQIVTEVPATWTGAASHLWDTNAINWITLRGPAAYVDGAQVTFDDSATGTTDISLPATVLPSGVIVSNNLENYSFSGPGDISGASSLVKAGAGTLTISNLNTYTGDTVIGGGTVNYRDGGGSVGTGTGSLYVGDASGKAVMNLNSTGTVTFATASNTLSMYVGGKGGSGDTGSGAVSQAMGTLNFGNANYLTFGAGANTYGAYTLSGGTLNILAGAGIRLGMGGQGSFVQSGGILNCGRWFAIGSASANGLGVATFSGGTATINSGYRFLIPDYAGATAVMNLGTEAGGDAAITHLNTTGLTLQNSSGGNGTLNLNRGTLQLGGPIFRNNLAGGSAIVNLNGATLQAGRNNVTLLDSSLGTVTVYNGGVVLDTQGYTTTAAASMASATGNGINPVGGVLTVESNGGAGYIGAPLVTVYGGSGSGAMALATISGGVVTNVILTCPGSDYQVGDVVSFVFSGGGADTPADPFNYTLQSGDLTANGAGGLTKLGTGTLTLSGYNTYYGSTIINGGALLVNGWLDAGSAVTVAGGALGGSGVIGGPVTVQSGGTLAPGGTLSINNALTLAADSTTFVQVNAGTGGSDLVQGITTVDYGGTLVVTNTAGTLTPGQTFQLFSATGHNDNFAGIQSAGGGGTWEFDPTNGVLTVLSVVATTPTNISYTLNGTALSLTWPGSHLGWYAQSNSVSVADPNAWYDIPNSQLATNLDITINPALNNVFYRLRQP